MKLPMVLLRKGISDPVSPLMRGQWGQYPHSPASCFFLLEASMVRETKFTLSNFWRRSAAIIGAMHLTITDSVIHILFLQWQIY